jgi:hypothetical protein
LSRISVITCLLLSVLPAGCGRAQKSIVNFSHLAHLTERISLSGDSVDIIHVYSNYPDYHWVSAAESGPEGVACVDDAGRAAVVYLRHYELTGDETSRSRAIALLRFILAMEAPDGQFYNFVRSDGSINRDGKTSYKSFGWWASRGVWAMGLGSRVLARHDSGFALLLRQGIERTFPHIDSLLLAYDTYKDTNHVRIPRWLLYESGADATSELLIGLTEYYAVTHNPAVRDYVTKLADGLIAMQEGNLTTYPYGLHRSWQNMWHMWGNGQTQALAKAGRVLQNPRMIQSAELEAGGFFSRLLILGFMKEIDATDSSKRVDFEQIAYAVRPVAVGLIRLYEATNDNRYLAMAGLAASWLLGDNVLHQPMYDSSTGRCYDGIRDPSTLNKNSGAESTIEALGTLIETEHYPLARKYLDARKLSSGRTARYIYALFRNASGDEATLAIDLAKPELLLLEGSKSAGFQEARKHD